MLKTTSMLRKTILFIFTLFLSSHLVAQKVSITSDQRAEYSLNGQTQGERSQIDFMLTKSRPEITVSINKRGYVPVERNYSRLYGKPVKSDHIKLVQDEAYLNSVEGDFANRNISVETEMAFEDAWRYLAMIIRSNFEVLEVADRNTGFMQSAWYLKKYNYYTVRQRTTISQSSLDPLVFSVRIDSEITSNAQDTKDSESYRKWDRVLKPQADMFSELQQRLKSK